MSLKDIKANIAEAFTFGNHPPDCQSLTYAPYVAVAFFAATIGFGAMINSKPDAQATEAEASQSVSVAAPAPSAE